jgi:hypothetical protein
MSEKKFDLSALKNEIATRNQSTAQRAASGRMNEGAVRKDKRAFLGGLVTSLSQGVPTEATSVISTISNVVESKHGHPQGKKISPVPQHHAPIINEVHNPPVMNNGGGQTLGQALSNVGSIINGQNPYGSIDGERGDMVFEQRMANSMNRMVSNFGQPQPMPQYPQNYGQPQSLNEQQMYQQMLLQQQQQVGGAMVNPQALNEHVKNQLFEVLDRNLEKLVEAAFKSVLTNVYSNERIHSAIDEYTKGDRFKNQISEVIKEIAKRQVQAKPQNGNTK